MEPRSDWVYQQDPKVAARVFRGEAALIPPRDRRIHILNGVATEIWGLLSQTPRTLEDLCSELEPLYDVAPDELRRDVESLLSELVAVGAVIRSATSGREIR